MATDAENLAVVTRLIAEKLGRDLSTPIGSNTLFFADLGLASIDAVVLGEALQAHFGKTLPFGDLMAQLGLRENRDLPIGELLAFLQKHVD